MTEGRTGEYPTAPREDRTEVFHGHVVVDPYRWLEDSGDERTRAWVAAQDALFDAERAAWPHLEKWQVALARLHAFPLFSVPRPRGDRVFFTHREPGAEHPVLLVAEHGAVRPLVDPLALDPGGRTVLEAWHPSVEGDLLAFQVSAAGMEDCVLRVIDVATGAVVDGPVDRVRRTPVAWLPGGRAYYYVRRLHPRLNPGEERYHRRVFLHRVGADPDDDVLVFGEGREKTSFHTVALTSDGRWLSVSSTVGTRPATDLWLADLTDVDGLDGALDRPRLRVVRVGSPARSRLRIAPGTAPGDPIWLRTDLDAPRGRIVVTTPAGTVTGTVGDTAGAETGAERWRTLIPERPDAVLEDFAPLRGPALPRPLALVSWTRHAVSEITLHDLADGRELAEVPLPGRGTLGRFGTRPEGGHEVWFGYHDHVTPPTVLRYDARTGTLEVWPCLAAPTMASPSRAPVLSGAPGVSPASVPGSPAACRVAPLPSPEPGSVTTTQVAFPSRDGVMVRMFVLSPHGVPDRRRPAILTGYGGFGTSMTPAYTPQALAWVRAGGVYAIACLRGGGEEGEEWHRAGTGVRKQNVFDDFDAATDLLIGQGWTAPDRLGVLGESNGGLLAAAALTQHPDKYAAVVCVAPLLDMLANERLGMGPSWRAEYGTVRDPAEFRALLAYSPYHRVREGLPYPPVLFAVADGDTRVDPGHSRKMCALLQHASAGPGPVLHRLDRGVGHGARSVSAKLGLLADVVAFLARHCGLDPVGLP
ncbi:prolyl oligopeptidase family serine peptidase [Microbispora sp. H10885]|uniref:prolyl oligopeptidase family serine peptidase n=1 Tax=Microbispora sp. H10885 TaxID=2729110 RepID=UPI0016008007|nr:prolyl oligopeptidase family serine peptidase [Microbispora sp. H10885]